MSRYVEERLAEIAANPGLRTERTAPVVVAPPKKEPPKKIQGTKRGHVYFATAGDLDHVKIGFTTDLTHRLYGLSTGSPHEFIFQKTFPTFIEAEAILHNWFRPDRIRGEWFRLTDAIEVLWDDILDYQLSVLTDESEDFHCFVPLDELIAMLESPGA